MIVELIFLSDLQGSKNLILTIASRLSTDKEPLPVLYTNLHRPISNRKFDVFIFLVFEHRKIQFVSGILTSLTWLWSFGFRLEPNFVTTPVASKNTTCFKSGQKWLKNSHLTLFTKARFSLKPWHTMYERNVVG